MSQELRTSEEWSNTRQDVIVMDPDGWDRRNFQFSWFEEKITSSEFQRRLMRSTVQRVRAKAVE